MKTGRNDPCPCGSGKKFKKCCADKVAPTPPATDAPALDRAPALDHASKPSGRLIPSRDIMLESGYAPSLIKAAVSVPGPFVSMHELPAHSAARLAEDPRLLDDPRLRSLLERRHREGWTTAKVSAMTTDVIAERLISLGIPFTTESFLASTLSQESAWAIADAWRVSPTVTCKGFDADFVGLAACELWKRLLPERPSMEMLDEDMQEGYAYAVAQHAVDASACWWRIWQHLRERFTPSMRTTNEAERVFRGRQILGNWCQDFEENLCNAALADVAYARIGLQYCEEWLRQFPDEVDDMVINFHSAKARMLFELGEQERGRSVLMDVVARWPTSVCGYLDLADDAMCMFRTQGSRAPDAAQARMWLERGLAAVTKDREVLVERIAALPRR